MTLSAKVSRDAEGRDLKSHGNVSPGEHKHGSLLEERENLQHHHLCQWTGSI